MIKNIGVTDVFNDHKNHVQKQQYVEGSHACPEGRKPEEMCSSNYQTQQEIQPSRFIAESTIPTIELPRKQSIDQRSPSHLMNYVMLFSRMHALRDTPAFQIP